VLRSRTRTLLAAATLASGLTGIAGLATTPAARAAASCVPDAHPGGEWRRMGQDIGHGRHQSAEKGIDRLQAPLLQPAWSFSVNEATGTMFNEVTGYPIVADGCVFVGSNAGSNAPGWIFALNADGGEVVWKTPVSNGIYSTLAVEDGVVYAFVSRIGSPYVVALDARTGAVLWQTTVDTQPGSDAVSSPVVYNGMVWVGVSGTAAEGDESTRYDFRGASVVLQAGRSGGQVLAHTFSIPDADWQLGEGAAGGAIWSTISIDPATGFGYVGTGNPFNYDNEHPHTNAVLKIDMRRTVGGAGNPSLGQIAGSYKGDVEEYFPALSENTSCDESDPVGFFMAGFECGRLDLDFGASPNIFTDRQGRRLVGIGQKSGVYHAFDPTTMQPRWKQVMGAPSAVGGIVGTAAFDGTALYVPHSIAGYIASLDRDAGTPKWVSPVADAVHWGNPVTSANGVVYTVDLKGFLDAYDAGTGAPLLHRPMAVGANTGAAPTFSWGGVTVARNTVYASVGVGATSANASVPAMPDGFVIAYRPVRTL
jgi:polyvinyl alcohol dehydrogenase (cytochrome)